MPQTYTTTPEHQNKSPSQSQTPQTNTTTPTIKITSPQSTTYNNPNISLSYEVENSDIQYYSLDKNENVTVFGSIILTNPSQGEHTIILYAENSNGKVEASEEITFTISLEKEKTSDFNELSFVAIGLWVSLNFGIMLKAPKILVKLKKSNVNHEN